MNRGQLSYLPPPTRDGLIKETVLLIGGCIAGIVVLGSVVYLLTL
jgi:hypothetical protein